MKKVVFVSVFIVALFISSVQALPVPTSKLISNFSNVEQVAKLKIEKEVYFKLPLKPDFLLNEDLSPVSTSSKPVFHPIEINGCTYLLEETVVVYCYVDSGPMPFPVSTPSVHNYPASDILVG